MLAQEVLTRAHEGLTPQISDEAQNLLTDLAKARRQQLALNPPQISLRNPSEVAIDRCRDSEVVGKIKHEFDVGFNRALLGALAKIEPTSYQSGEDFKQAVEKAKSELFKSYRGEKARFITGPIFQFGVAEPAFTAFKTNNSTVTLTGMDTLQYFQVLYPGSYIEYDGFQSYSLWPDGGEEHKRIYTPDGLIVGLKDGQPTVQGVCEYTMGGMEGYFVHKNRSFRNLKRDPRFGDIFRGAKLVFVTPHGTSESGPQAEHYHTRFRADDLKDFVKSEVMTMPNLTYSPRWVDPLDL